MGNWQKIKDDIMLIIREAKLSDAKTLAQLGAQTFFETYSLESPKGDMGKYISTAFSEKKIKKELSDKNSAFLLANLDGKDIGYAKMGTDRQIDKLKGRKIIELKRLYVLKDFIGKKIGKGLTEHCLEYAKNNKFEVIWTQVWHKNSRAIEFYKKWGFKEFDKGVFELGDIKQSDIRMKKELSVSNT